MGYATPGRKSLAVPTTPDLRQQVLTTDFVTLRKKQKPKLTNRQTMFSLTSTFSDDLHKPESSISISSENKSQTSGDSSSLDIIPDTQTVEKTKTRQSKSGTTNKGNNSLVTSRKSTKTDGNKVHLKKRLFCAEKSDTLNDVDDNYAIKVTSSNNDKSQLQKTKTPAGFDSVTKRKRTVNTDNNKRRKTMASLETYPEESSALSLLQLSSREISQTKSSPRIECMSPLRISENSSGVPNIVTFSNKSDDSSQTKDVTNKPGSSKRSSIKKTSNRRNSVRLPRKTNVNNMLNKKSPTISNDCKTMQKIPGPSVKSSKRKLFNPNAPIDSYNIDYDKEYEKSAEITVSISNVSKKTTNSTHLSPLCLTDKPKNVMTSISDCIYVNKKNKRNIEDNVKGKPNNIKSVKSTKKLAVINEEAPAILNRRSTMEFQIITTQKAKTKIKSRKKYITCSYFHKTDVKQFEQTIKKLGEFIIENNVTERTTHLVVADCVRTLNVLRALARGCWILKRNWVRNCLITQCYQYCFILYLILIYLYNFS